MITGNTGQLSYLIDDRDGAVLPLAEVLRTEGVEVIKTPPKSPPCNAYAERFVRENRETLDNLILLGFEYPDQPAPLATMRRDAALGGLLNHYYAERIAA